MARHYIQGYFKPKRPEKYVGDINNIYYRSSWELKFLNWCDSNPSVLKYNNEELVIPYISPVDKRPHRYFVDFVIMVKTRTNEIKKYAVEIKPNIQRSAPRSNGKKTKKYLTEMATYVVNTEKWKAADLFCQRNNMDFIVLDEYDLGIKTRPQNGM
jgi:hypothetical protein